MLTAAATESESMAVPDAAFVSVALTVMGNDPPAVGFPLRTPAVLRLNPAGSEPLARAHV
jgi:hypothetical protein